MTLQKVRNAALSLHSASLRTKRCKQKNKQASPASGPSAQETGIKFRLERATGLFGQKPIVKQQHEREASGDWGGGKTGSQGKERRTAAPRVTGLRQRDRGDK